MSCIRINIDRLAAFSSLLSLISAFLTFIIAIQILKEPGEEVEEGGDVIVLRQRIEDLENQVHTLNRMLPK